MLQNELKNKSATGKDVRESHVSESLKGYIHIAQSSKTSSLAVKLEKKNREQ